MNYFDFLLDGKSKYQYIKALYTIATVAVYNKIAAIERR